ncbi:MAG: hypothetical protein AAF889_12550 [Cyanobacteria bacterium P01_D01_bin.73]
MKQENWILLAYIGFIFIWRQIVSSIEILTVLSSLPLSDYLPQNSPVLIWNLIVIGVPLILFFETYIKYLIVNRVLGAVEFLPVQLESFDYVDQSKFKKYTIDFETLGFNRLIDYTVSHQGGVGRVFVNLECQCFAEIGQAEQVPMFCSVSGCMEKDYAVAVANLSMGKDLDSVDYSFLTAPEMIGVRLNTTSVELLFESFLSLRSRVMEDLDISPIPLKTAEDNFEFLRLRQRQKRQALLRSSITVRLIKMFDYRIRPKPFNRYERTFLETGKF